MMTVNRVNLLGNLGADAEIKTLANGDRPPGGDPSLIWVPPVEQWRNQYLFLVPNKYAFDFLLIALPARATLTYDTIPIDDVLTCEPFRSAIGLLSEGSDQSFVQAVDCAAMEKVCGAEGDSVTCVDAVLE